MLPSLSRLLLAVTGVMTPGVIIVPSFTTIPPLLMSAPTNEAFGCPVITTFGPSVSTEPLPRAKGRPQTR